MGFYLTNKRKPQITSGASRKPPNTNGYKQDKKLQDRYHETRFAVLTWDLLTTSWSMTKGLMFTCWLPHRSQWEFYLNKAGAWIQVWTSGQDALASLRVFQGLLHQFCNDHTLKLQFIFIVRMRPCLQIFLQPVHTLLLHGIIKEFNLPKGNGIIFLFN